MERYLVEAYDQGKLLFRLGKGDVEINGPLDSPRDCYLVDRWGFKTSAAAKRCPAYRSKYYDSRILKVTTCYGIIQSQEVV